MDSTKLPRSNDAASRCASFGDRAASLSDGNKSSHAVPVVVEDCATTSAACARARRVAGSSALASAASTLVCVAFRLASSKARQCFPAAVARSTAARWRVSGATGTGAPGSRCCSSANTTAGSSEAAVTKVSASRRALGSMLGDARAESARENGSASIAPPRRVCAADSEMWRAAVVVFEAKCRFVWCRRAVQHMCHRLTPCW